ncbi:MULTISPECIES: hypothetical protein [unclassified Lentimonas]|uniref:hypothetical protein n=1 Tax=unclassified Lentimonas TaxID=2630993 RepID=UPI00138A0858|nr:MULTISPECIES: hypothetical protein [unclassified Lentimonas]
MAVVTTHSACEVWNLIQGYAQRDVVVRYKAGGERVASQVVAMLDEDFGLSQVTVSPLTVLVVSSLILLFRDRTAMRKLVLQ